MRPFNLQQALAGKPVITRDGRKVSELHYFKTIEYDATRIAVIVEGKLFFYFKDGKFWNDRGDNLDLFMAPETVTKWVNVRMIDGKYYTSRMYDTEEEAKNECYEYITTIPITFNI